MSSGLASRSRPRLVAALLAAALAVPAMVMAVPGRSDAVTCATSVRLVRTAHRVLATGVVLDTYTASVTTLGSTRSARVIRATLPRGSRPTLLQPGLGLVQPIMTQVRSLRPKALLAVNGDFFGYYQVNGHRPTVLPRSYSVSRRHVLRAAAVAKQVVGVDTAGHPYSGPLAVDGTVTDASTSYRLGGVNATSVSADAATLYTRAWNPSSSTPRPVGAVEWVVAGRRITALWTGASRGAPVPPQSSVVAFGSKAAAVAGHAKVGDDVTITVTQHTTTGVRLGEAIGTQGQLVSAGRVAVDCRRNSAEPRPRTSIGWGAKSRWMTLVVPGTGYDSTGYRFGGLDIPEEAAVAARLGFRNASILDGGGSLTELARRGTTWRRLDDVHTAWERSVPNGLAFTAH